MNNKKQNKVNKIYRSRKDKMIAGVIGGLGEYLDVDPTIIRLIWIGVTAFSGFLPGVIIYLLASLIIPLKPLSQNEE